jgi:alpha-D-xyloside xylohydrolase
LLPYIYSLAWMTTSASYTPMRALVMDFRTDPRTANITDQYMFGPAILVNPVTEPGVSTRRLYLPAATWYDFWNGTSIDGPRTLDASAPLERLPLYVRAGSILPMGPEIEWSTEKPENPIELRVYRGANADFVLYEDENDNYNYEKGAYATVPFHWDEAKQILTIGNRKGQFPGMLESRTFQVVFVGQNHGVGISPIEKNSMDEPDKVVQYSGKEVTVTP